MGKVSLANSVMKAVLARAVSQRQDLILRVGYVASRQRWALLSVRKGYDQLLNVEPWHNVLNVLDDWHLDRLKLIAAPLRLFPPKENHEKIE